MSSVLNVIKFADPLDCHIIAQILIPAVLNLWKDLNMFSYEVKDQAAYEGPSWPS